MAEDVKIKLTTEADVSGAKKAEEALEKVEDQAKQTEAASQDATGDGGFNKLDSKSIVDGWMKNAKAAAEAKGEIDKVTESTGQLGEAFDKASLKGLELGKIGGTLKDLSKVAGAESAAMGGYFAAVAASAKWSVGAVSDTLGSYTELIAEMEARGMEVTPELKLEVESWKATLGWMTTIEKAWEKMKEAISNPADFFSGAADTRKWMEEDKKFLDFANKAQAKFVEERFKLKATNAAEMYDNEARGLEKHLKLQQQINRARAELDNVAVARAQNQVTIAEQDGGDVAAAEANVLLVQLQTSLASLKDGVASAQNQVEIAGQSLSAAKMDLNIAIQENRPEAEIEKLEGIVQAREDAFDIAENALKNQSALVKEKAALAAENTEIALVELQDKYKGQISKGAKAGMDAVQAEIEKVANSPETIAQAAAVVKTITDGANATTEKINQAVTAVEPINAAQQQSVSGLQTTLETQGQIAEKLATAVQALNTEQGKILGVIQQVQSGVSSRDPLLQKIMSDVQNMQLQISQLFMK